MVDELANEPEPYWEQDAVNDRDEYDQHVRAVEDEERERVADHGGERACRCKLWEQRWMPDHPERCSRCGGMFAANTVEARKPIPGEVLRDD